MQRAVVITGASTGIGRACALRLDSAGWRVFAGVRKEADAKSLKGEASDRLATIKIDVADGASVKAAATKVRKALDGQGLSGLVNNAGITVQGPLEYLDPDDLRRQFEVNVTGQIVTTQAFLPMIREARGRIVFMSSVAGRSPSIPLAGPYSASKYAIEALAESLRLELIPWGIKVSSIEPGTIATEIWDKGLDSASAAIEAMSDEERERYGVTMERATTLTKSLIRRAISPDKVAEKVQHALESRRPRIHYLVGTDARVRTYIESNIPKPLRDRFIGKTLGYKKR